MASMNLKIGNSRAAKILVAIISRAV